MKPFAIQSPGERGRRGFPKDAVEWIRADNLYRPALSLDLSQKRYSYGRRVIESLLKFDEIEVADTSIELSKAMCKELDLKAEQLIVDLVKSSHLLEVRYVIVHQTVEDFGSGR